MNRNTRHLQALRGVPLIESVLAMDYHAMTLTGRELPENVNVIGLSSNGFQDLGMRTALGRGLSRSDAIPTSVVGHTAFGPGVGYHLRAAGVERLTARSDDSIAQRIGFG